MNSNVIELLEGLTTFLRAIDTRLNAVEQKLNAQPVATEFPTHLAAEIDSLRAKVEELAEATENLENDLNDKVDEGDLDRTVRDIISETNFTIQVG